MKGIRVPVKEVHDPNSRLDKVEKGSRRLRRRVNPPAYSDVAGIGHVMAVIARQYNNTHDTKRVIKNQKWLIGNVDEA